MAWTRLGSEILVPGGLTATVPSGCNAIVMQWGAMPGGASVNMASISLGGSWATNTIAAGHQVSGDSSGKEAMGTATAIGGAAGAHTLTPTWSGALGANAGPLYMLTYYTVDSTSDWIRDIDAASQVTTPSSITLDSSATDEVLAFDFDFGAAPATESGWTSVNSFSYNSGGGRLRTADSPGATTTATVQGASIYRGITAIAIKNAGGAAPTITGPTGAAGAASITHTVSEAQNVAGTWTATGSVSWSLTGTDAADLSISVGGVVTKASGNFSFAAKPSYSFNVVNGSSSQAVTLAISAAASLKRLPATMAGGMQNLSGGT